MFCKKCHSEMQLIAEELMDDTELIEVRAECNKCDYWVFAFVKKTDFVVED